MSPIQQRLLLPMRVQLGGILPWSVQSTLGKIFWKRVPAVLMASLMLSGSAVAATYYVSNSGNDANSGTTPRLAWRTIGRVNLMMPLLRPGDSVLLERGSVFRDSCLQCIYAKSSPVGVAPTCSGTEDHRLTIGAYGDQKRPPVLDGADPLSLSWTRVQGSTFEANIVGQLPTKLYVDAPLTMSAQLLPVANATGEFSPTSVYHPLDLVTSKGDVYVRGMLKPSASSSLSNASTWVVISNNNQGNATQTFPTANTGLQNVESMPGSWYASGSTIYVNLPDGSNPNRHTFEGTYRPYGVLLVGANYFSIMGLIVEHVQQSGIISVPLTVRGSGSTGGSYIQITNNQVWNYGSIVCDELLMQDQKSPLQAGILIRAGSEINPALVHGAFIGSNRVGRMDSYFGIRRDQFQAGIIASGIDGEGPANRTVIQGNYVSTVNVAGIFYNTAGLRSVREGPQLLNHGGRVTGNELVNNQGNLFFTATAGGSDDHNIIHDSYGEGVQSGGNSTSTPEAPQVHAFDLIYHLGKSASGVLFNGFDCNGNLSGGYWLNNTVYDANSAAITFEGGCDSAHVQNNVFDQNALRFPTYDVLNPSYLMYYKSDSARQHPQFSNNIWINGTNPKPFHGTTESYSCETYLLAWPDTQSACLSKEVFRDPSHGDFRLSPEVRSAHPGAKGEPIGAVVER